MRYKIILLLTLLGSITYITAELNNLFGEDYYKYPEYSPTVNFSNTYALPDFPSLLKSEKSHSAQNRSMEEGVLLSAMIPSSENPFRAKQHDSKNEETSNQDSHIVSANDNDYFSKKGSEKSTAVSQNSEFEINATSRSQHNAKDIATIGNMEPQELFSTTVSGRSMLSVTGSNDEDPFDEGGGSDPNDGYNDVPIGDGNWYLLLLVFVYLFIKKRKLVTNEKLTNITI